MKTILLVLTIVLAVAAQGCGDACRPACAPAACVPACPAAPLFAAPALAAPVSEVAAAPAGRVSVDDLLHHRFVLVSVNGAPLPKLEVESPYIEFNEGMNVSGRACNQFHGQGKLDNGILTVERMVMTRMFCIVPELNELENILAAILDKGAALSLSGGELTLSGDNAVLVYRLRDLVH